MPNLLRMAGAIGDIKSSWLSLWQDDTDTRMRVYRSVIVLQWWLPVRLDEFRFQVWLVVPLPARFITGSGSPAVSNLSEYSCSHLPPGRRCVYAPCGWTNCPSRSPAVKPVVGPFMTDDCLICVVILPSDRRLSLGYRHSVRWTKQQIQQTGSEFSHRMYFFVAVLSASVALDWDDIWGQSGGREFFSLLLVSAASDIKKENCMIAKSYFFFPVIFPNSTLMDLLCVININDRLHSLFLFFKDINKPPKSVVWNQTCGPLVAANITL